MSDFARHRLTRRLLVISVVFALLYGFFMVNFVDSTYFPSTASPNQNGTFSCTYPSATGCDNYDCLTMQNCVQTNGNSAGDLSPLASYYDVWLFGIYFAPFVLVSIALRGEHWEFMLSLGLLVWFVNDGLWGFYHMLNVGMFSSDPSSLAVWAFGSSSPARFWDCPLSSPTSSWNWGVFWCWAKNWWGFSPRNLFNLQIGTQHPIVSGQAMTATLLGRVGASSVLLYKWQGTQEWTAKSWADTFAQLKAKFSWTAR
jgi:hypothetical protein